MLISIVSRNLCTLSLIKAAKGTRYTQPEESISFLFSYVSFSIFLSLFLPASNLPNAFNSKVSQVSHVNRLPMEITHAPFYATVRDTTVLRFLGRDYVTYGWETRSHSVLQAGRARFTFARASLTKMPLLNGWNTSVGERIHRYRSDRGAPIRESDIRHTFCFPTLVPSDEWQSRRRPDTVHRREVSPERLDLWPARTHLRGESDPPDSGLEIARSECDSRVQSLVIATLADRHGTLDKTGGSLGRWGRPLSLSLFLSHIGQERIRHTRARWDFFRREPMSVTRMWARRRKLSSLVDCFRKIMSLRSTAQETYNSSTIFLYYFFITRIYTI